MNRNDALASVAQWIECRPAKQMWQVWFPARAHAWVAGGSLVGGV